MAAPKLMITLPSSAKLAKRQRAADATTTDSSEARKEERPAEPEIVPLVHKARAAAAAAEEGEILSSSDDDDNPYHTATVGFLREWQRSDGSVQLRVPMDANGARTTVSVHIRAAALEKDALMIRVFNPDADILELAETALKLASPTEVELACVIVDRINYARHYGHGPDDTECHLRFGFGADLVHARFEVFERIEEDVDTLYCFAVQIPRSCFEFMSTSFRYDELASAGFA